MTKKPGISVSISPFDELAEKVNDRQHWIAVFPAGDVYVDDLDKAIGIWPSFPTALVPSPYGMFSVTVIPKSRISRKRMSKILTKLIEKPVEVGVDQDLLMCVPETEPEKRVLCDLFIRWVAGPQVG